MKFFKLDLCVLSFKNKATTFLNATTTNIPQAPQNAFIDLKGKIIVTFYQRWVSEDEIWILFENKFKERLLSHLKKYLPLYETTYEEVFYETYFNLDSCYQEKDGEIAIPQKVGKLILTKSKLEVKVSEDEFNLFRLKNNLPRQGVDYDDEFLLNIGEDHVSYTKGCYLGQEIIAKVHFRSAPSKKLVVKAEDEVLSQEKMLMTSKVFDPAQGKVLGFTFDYAKLEPNGKNG